MPAGSQPLGIRSPNYMQYAAMIANVWRTPMWLPEQDYALAEDPDVWEKVQLDIHVKSGIQTRLHKVAGRPSHLEPGGRDDADNRVIDIVQEGCLDAVENLAQAKLNLAKGVFTARTYGYIEAMRMPWQAPGTELVLDWWIPTRIEDVQRERIRFVPRTEPDPETGRIRVLPPWVEVSALDVGSWNRLSVDDWRNYVKFVYDDDERRLGMGRGGLSAIYLASYVRAQLLKHGLQGAEKLGQGLAIAKMDMEREASAGKSNDAIKTAYINTLAAQRDAANVMVVPVGDEIEYVFPQGSGGSLILGLLEYNDACLTRYLTSALLPSGGGSDVGSNARAEVEQDEASEIIQYESNLLEDRLSRDLVGQFMRMNRANLARCGLAAARRPRIAATKQVRMSPKEAADTAAVLTKFLDLKKDEVHELTGFSMPTEEDYASGNVIEATPDPSPMEMGLGADPDTPPGLQPPSGNPALDRARGMADRGLRRKGLEAMQSGDEDE